MQARTMKRPGVLTEARELVGEWQGLMEGVQDEHLRAVMAQMFQNQFDFLSESVGGQLTEASFSSNTGAFTKYIFPILSDLFPNLIANQLFSIQPMNSPVGAVFFWDWIYGTTKGNVTSGESFTKNFNKHFSSEFIDYEVLWADGPGSNTASLGSATSGVSKFTFLPIHPKTDSKNFVVKIAFTNSVGSAASIITDDGAGNLVFNTENVGTINYSTGVWAVNFTGATGTPLFEAGAPITCSYFYDQERVGTVTTDTGQQSALPEAEFDLTYKEIRAKRRSMKFKVSTDAIDDLRALQGLDAEKIMVAGMARQMALGLDREMIDDVVIGAKYSATYSHGASFGGADTMRPLDSTRELMTTISAVSAAILKGSNRANANFIVTSPEVVNWFEQLATFGDYMSQNKIIGREDAGSYGSLDSQYPISNVGVLSKRYRVFEDPYMDSDTILVGLKGRDYADSGYAYCPYIPMEVTDSFVDPNDLTMRKGMRSRYATELLRPEYYGVITVSGLPTVAVAG